MSALPPQVRRAVCPGSFDPVTNGHLDIIDRASRLYDEIVVAVFVNQTKIEPVQRRRAIARCWSKPPRDYPNVRIDTFHGLVVDYCRANDIPVIVKGLRAVSDFDYELQMAQMNRGLAGVDTLFMPTNPEYSFLASSLVKEIAKLGRRRERAGSAARPQTAAQSRWLRPRSRARTRCSPNWSS